MLQVSHLTKRYGHVVALDDVSFSIRPGEVLGLIGPNGSGKTTLFECLAGVLPADGGAVLRDGVALPLRERSSALFYMPDGIAPWPGQTVRWALDFAAGFFGQGPADEQGPPEGGHYVRDGVVRDGVVRGGVVRGGVVRGGVVRGGVVRGGVVSGFSRTFDLDPLLDVRIGELSKGQRKRVLLAIGLLTPQPVLLADEPFDGLDLRQTRDIGSALRAYAANGRTLFLSIHQIADAARFCDRFVLLSGGRVRGEGTRDELSDVARHPHGDRRKDLEEIFLALT